MQWMYFLLSLGSLRDEPSATPSSTDSTLLATTQNPHWTTHPRPPDLVPMGPKVLQPTIESSQKTSLLAHTLLTSQPSSIPKFSMNQISTPLRKPCHTEPVWVFFVHCSLREITLKTLSFLNIFEKKNKTHSRAQCVSLHVWKTYA